MDIDEITDGLSKMIIEFLKTKRAINNTERSSQNNNNDNNNTQKFNGQCHNCGKFGHMVRNCRSPRRDNQRENYYNDRRNYYPNDRRPSYRSNYNRDRPVERRPVQGREVRPEPRNERNVNYYDTSYDHYDRYDYDQEYNRYDGRHLNY
jgi:hypothetical protein